MTDREKVVKGMQHCLEIEGDGTCEGCPYDDDCFAENVEFGEPMMYDALALLKAQEPVKPKEPRILTVEEVEDALDTVVWVDRPYFANSHANYALILSYSRKREEFDVMYFRGDHYATFSYSGYGRSYRFWNKRPTDEQREAAKWE